MDNVYSVKEKSTWGSNLVFCFLFFKENTCDSLTSDGMTDVYYKFEGKCIGTQIGYNIHRANKERDFRDPGVK